MGKYDANTVFIMKGNQPVKVQWADSNTIAVHYPSDAEDDWIYKKIKEHGGLKIEYRLTSKMSEKTRYLEYSNVNYGATGISAQGTSEDILLRWAGWSQEKSGMTREEWGHWYGQPPYGDDPKEQYYIKQGIEMARNMGYGK
jgi:hypothetical protein